MNVTPKFMLLRGSPTYRCTKIGVVETLQFEQIAYAESFKPLEDYVVSNYREGQNWKIQDWETGRTVDYIGDLY